MEWTEQLENNTKMVLPTYMKLMFDSNAEMFITNFLQSFWASKKGWKRKKYKLKRTFRSTMGAPVNIKSYELGPWLYQT